MTGKRKTKKFTVQAIFFLQNRREILKSKEWLYFLPYALSVKITFVDQKNGQKYATITQHTSRKEICPVKSWAAIIIRILLYPNTGLDTDIDTFDAGPEN